MHAQNSDVKWQLTQQNQLQRLLKYFKGANDQGKKIYLTTPTVTAFVLTDDGKGTEKNYTFGYFIPKKLCVRILTWCFRCSYVDIERLSVGMLAALTLANLSGRTMCLSRQTQMWK